MTIRDGHTPLPVPVVVAKLLDGRMSVCEGHIADCDCSACQTVRKAIDELYPVEERSASKETP